MSHGDKVYRKSVVMQARTVDEHSRFSAPLRFPKSAQVHLRVRACKRDFGIFTAIWQWHVAKKFLNFAVLQKKSQNVLAFHFASG